MKVNFANITENQLWMMFEMLKAFRVEVYSNEGDVLISDCRMDETMRFEVAPSHYAIGIKKAWDSFIANQFNPLADGLNNEAMKQLSIGFKWINERQKHINDWQIKEELIKTEDAFKLNSKWAKDQYDLMK